MRGASREAFGLARSRLAELTRTGDSDALAAGLRAVARLLVAEPSLRRALADPALAGEARVGLARDLLADRISQQATEVFAVAVSHRWSSPTDLVTGVELLAVEAELLGAESGGTLADVEDELFRFSRIVTANPVLATTLADEIAPTQQRAELVQELLAAKANPVTVRLVIFALTGIGGRSFDTALDYLVQLAAQVRERTIAHVLSASVLTTEQETQLTSRLASIYGQKISLKMEVDPDLLGGVVIRVGDDLYDGTVVHKLAQARAELTKQ